MELQYLWLRKFTFVAAVLAVESVIMDREDISVAFVVAVETTGDGVGKEM